jgi:hypothetical protein
MLAQHTRARARTTHNTQLLTADVRCRRPLSSSRKPAQLMVRARHSSTAAWPHHPCAPASPPPANAQHTHTRTYTRAHTRTRTRTHAPRPQDMHTHIHPLSHTRHTHTHTHTQLQVQPALRALPRVRTRLLAPPPCCCCAPRCSAAAATALLATAAAAPAAAAVGCCRLLLRLPLHLLLCPSEQQPAAGRANCSGCLDVVGHVGGQLLNDCGCDRE